MIDRSARSHARLHERWSRVTCLGLALTLLTLVSSSTPLSVASSTVPLSAPRLTDQAGSTTVGSARYPVPPGAVYVSPAGDDAFTGSLQAPVRTITKAIAVTRESGTIILREGSYHESVTISEKRVTIQNYPGESAWLEGSSPVSGWVPDGSVWRHDGWSVRLDSSPTYTKGAPDRTEPGWSFINRRHPMAAHPDQLFIDGVPQRQVRLLSQVTPGAFYLDEGASRLYVGSDPRGRSVQATDLRKAITVRTAGTVLRGFGVRHFGPSVWQMGAITLERPHIQVSNLEIDDTSTTGLAAIADDITLDHVTVRRAGMLGIHASTADHLQLLSVRAEGNNSEHFNHAPVSGGIKVGRSRTLTVKNSVLSNNLGPGFWADQSVYDVRLTDVDVNSNDGTGVFLEISAKAWVVNSLITMNGGAGIKVNNTSDVHIWNNSLVGNHRSIEIVQDARLANSTAWGHDPRRQPPGPEMTWKVGPVTIYNNVLALPGDNGDCLLCVEDYTFRRSAELMGINSDSNVYNRRRPDSPRWTDVWSNGLRDPKVFTTLAQFKASTGQDRSSLAYDLAAIITRDGTLAPSVVPTADAVAQPLPWEAAQLAGVPTGYQHMGVWGR